MLDPLTLYNFLYLLENHCLVKYISITGILILFFFAACNGKSASSEIKNKLQISKDGFKFQLMQRDQIEIPSDSNNVFCSIDDITGGQTHLLIRAGNEILIDSYIYEGDILKFAFNNEKYSIECRDLINNLIGEDYGNFKIVQLSNKSNAEKDESAQIEELLKKIETSRIIFIRNGTEYSSKEAAEHLRSKWRESKGKVKTMDSFIENIASTSSMSGKPYLVKMNNGEIILAKSWYKEQLKN